MVNARSLEDNVECASCVHVQEQTMTEAKCMISYCYFHLAPMHKCQHFHNCTYHSLF